MSSTTYSMHAYVHILCHELNVSIDILQEIECDINNVRELPRDTNLRLQVCDIWVCYCTSPL